MDASNMLKPMLARGELHAIGATTLDQYRKYIEKDAALERRFQQVFVGEPRVEDTISILRGLRERYEVHHNVRILDSALVAAAVLSHRYIGGRFLPDKAIDLVDEAASRLRMERPKNRRTGRTIQTGHAVGDRARSLAQGGATTPARQRLSELETELANLKERRAELTAQWDTSADRLRLADLKEQIGPVRRDRTGPT